MDAKAQKKSSTKKNVLKKLFNNGSKKNTSSVSPQSPQENEWFPSSFDTYVVSDDTTSHRTLKSRRSNEELYKQQQSVSRSNSVQRRFSFSNVHESGQKRLLAAKRAEYQEKMRAFDDLIQRRRGSTLRLALAPDVTSY